MAEKEGFEFSRDNALGQERLNPQSSLRSLRGTPRGLTAHRAVIQYRPVRIPFEIAANRKAPLWNLPMVQSLERVPSGNMEIQYPLSINAFNLGFRTSKPADTG